MRVRFFPYTHVSDAVADVLKRLFDEVAVIVAAEEDTVPEGLTALKPSAGDAERLRSLLAGWRGFSGLHREGLTAYALGLGRRVDPLDEQLASQIKSELMRQVKGGAARAEGADALTVARALLSLAAEYDLRQRDLGQELARIDKLQLELLDTLKGEVPGLPETPAADTPSQEVGMLKRLSAWATLFLAEEGSPRDRVFVTTSPEALDLMAEYGCPLEELGSFCGERFSGEVAEKLLGNEAPEGMLVQGAVDAGGPVTVRIFIARGEHPYTLFNEFTRKAGVCCGGCEGQCPDMEGDSLFVLLGGVALR